MEREIRNTGYNSQDHQDVSQNETERLTSFEAAEMADRGPKTLSADGAMPDADKGAFRAVANTPGDEDDDLDDDDDDLIDDDDDLDDADVVDDDDDLEVTDADIDEDLNDDDLLLDDDEEDEEDDL